MRYDGLMSDTETTPSEPADASEIDFVINPDGSVTFRRLPPELLDLARALDPDAVLACDIPGEDTTTKPSP